MSTLCRLDIGPQVWLFSSSLSSQFIFPGCEAMGFRLTQPLPASAYNRQKPKHINICTRKTDYSSASDRPECELHYVKKKNHIVICLVRPKRSQNQKADPTHLFPAPCSLEHHIPGPGPLPKRCPPTGATPSTFGAGTAFGFGSLNTLGIGFGCLTTLCGGGGSKNGSGVGAGCNGIVI